MTEKNIKKKRRQKKEESGRIKWKEGRKGKRRQ
jgi:hypothetical protein